VQVSSLDSLKVPAFRSYFIGRTISHLGGSLSTLALTFGILEAGGSAADLGLIIGASTLPQLVLLLVGGVIGDRFERRRILVVSDITMGVAQIATAMLLLHHSAHVWQLVGLQFANGCASAFFNPASNGAVRDFVGPEKAQQAQSLLGITGSLTRIVGPAIAAILIAATSAGIALAIDGVSFFVSAAFLMRIPREDKTVSLGGSIWTDLQAGWKEVTSRSWVVSYIGAACSYQATALPALMILGPLIAVAHMGGAGAWATIMTAEAIGALTAGVVLTRWHPEFPMKQAVRLLMLGSPLFFILALPHVKLAWLILPAFLSGVAIPMADTLWLAALAEHIPDNAQARVSSYDWLGSLALAPLGYALMGHLANKFNSSAILITVGLIDIAVSCVLLTVPGVRHLTRRASHA